MGKGLDNNLIKKGHTRVKFTEKQLDELIKCSEDPLYFMQNYIWIQSNNGRELFKPFDYQLELVSIFHNYRNSIALLSRQMGKSTTACAYILWRAMFIDDTTVLIAANVLKQALEIMQRIRFSYEELPDFIRAGVIEYNKGSISFDNGSRIICTATTANSGRGMTVNLLYLDEFSFVSPGIAKDFWTSIRPTLGTQGRCIITSTPNNDEDQFSQIWKGANATLDEYGNELPGGVGKNGFKAIKVTWEQHPERNQEWADQEISAIGMSRFQREHNCMFVTSDETLIDSQVLSTLEGTNELYKIDEIRWYSELEPNKTYLIGLDPSVGTGGDAAAIEVYQLPEMKQVAEWRHNKTSVVGQIRVLLQILRHIDQTLRSNKAQKGVPEIYWTIENNGMGESALQVVEDTGEEIFPGLFVHEPKKRGRNTIRRKGLYTGATAKLNACTKLKSLIETGRIKIYSKMLIRELKFYVRSGQSFDHKWGETDDLISATLLVIRLMMILQNWDPDLVGMLKEDADIDDDDYIAPLPISVLKY